MPIQGKGFLMKSKIKLAILIVVALLVGWGLWKIWRFYDAVKNISEAVPGMSMGTDGFSMVKEDGQGNKFNIRFGGDGLSIAGEKDGLPVEVKIDRGGMKVGHGDKQIQIPLEELKKQLKLMSGIKEESEN